MAGLTLLDVQEGVLFYDEIGSNLRHDEDTAVSTNVLFIFIYSNRKT